MEAGEGGVGLPDGEHMAGRWVGGADATQHGDGVAVDGGDAFDGPVGGRGVVVGDGDCRVGGMGFGGRAEGDGEGVGAEAGVEVVGGGVELFDGAVVGVLDEVGDPGGEGG